ncbi:MAG TPA: methylmalonyl-CoA epimerase [Friedmanniella sp.]
MDDHPPGSTPPDARLRLLGIVALDHVGLAVPDLDVAIRLHTDVLGLVLVHREVNERQGVAEAMLAAPAGGAEVQLLAPLHEGSVIARFLSRAGPGLQHLAYRVVDVDVACAVLRSRDVRLLYDQPEAGTRGSRINFVHPKDAGGVLVELVETPGPHREGDAARVAHDPAGGWVAGG